MIEGINLCKTFDRRPLFDTFNFKIETGEFVLNFATGGFLFLSITLIFFVIVQL